MTENERPALPSSAQPDPTDGGKAPIADCREEQLPSGNNDDPTESFVSACLVRVQGNPFDHGANLEVILPLMDDEDEVEGEGLRVADHIRDVRILARVKRLPLKSLANPDIALVTRRSLLRLVEAARAERSEKLTEALQPFTMFHEEGSTDGKS